MIMPLIGESLNFRFYFSLEKVNIFNYAAEGQHEQIKENLIWNFSKSWYAKQYITNLILTALALCIYAFEVKYKASYKMFASSWQF